MIFKELKVGDKFKLMQEHPTIFTKIRPFKSTKDQKYNITAIRDHVTHISYHFFIDQDEIVEFNQ